MEKKGVSPVVGTILLIAITVALAAIVAMLVSGLGGRGAAPSALLAVTAGNAHSGSGDNIKITISHNGGDDLIISDLQLQASIDSANTMEIIPIVATGATLRVGGTVTGTYEYSGITSGTAIKVFIIHVPSKQKLIDTTAVVG